jgi:hypothetical protein
MELLAMLTISARTITQRFVRFLSILLCVAVLSPSLSAQLTGKIAEKPIAIGYMRDIGQLQMIEYIQSLMQRLEIGKTMQEEMTSEQMTQQAELSFTKVEHPLYGVAWYMVTGLIPSFQTVTFQEVIDEADARRLVNGRKQQWGENGTFEDLGNGCFKVLYNNTYSFELPMGVDEAQYTSQNTSGQPSGWTLTYKIVEKDGKKFVEQTQSSTTLLRFHDRMLYEATFEELFTMQLPSADSITSGVDGSNDLGYDAYLDRIPQGIRMLGWNVLTAAVSTQLQQRDDEPESIYEMRRKSGDAALALVKTVLFDIDNSDGWLRFASENDPSIRGELRVRARNNSQLSKQLLEAQGVSRFAAILSDNAAVTAHVCVRLPEEAPEALLATGTWLQEAVSRETNNDTAMVAAAAALSETLAGIAEHRNLELLFKTGWTKESGGVFYGGIQLNDNPQLLSSIHHFFTHAPDIGPDVDRIFQLTEVDGMQMILIQPPAEAVDEIRSETGMTLSHIWLAHQNSCLWFAAGTENSKDIIRQSVARCTEGSAARTPLLSARIDMERWLSYPQDDAAGITQLPHFLDENAWWFPPNPMGSILFMGFGQQFEKPNPIMQRAFDLGGSQQFWLTVDADDNGILLQTSLGEALANHMLARGIDTQETMMAAQRKQIEEMQAQQEKALKEAQQAVPIPEPPAP